MNSLIYIIKIFLEDSLIIKKFFHYFPIKIIELSISRIIILIFPELIILLYKYFYYLKSNNNILKLMIYINERYLYDFNNSENDFICKVNNNNFDIHLYLKRKHMEKDLKIYSNPIKSLTKNVFYDYAIIYSNKLLCNFNYKMCNLKETEIIIGFFQILKETEKDFKKNNNILHFKFVFNFIQFTLELNEIKNNYNIIIIIILKILLLFVGLYLEKIYTNNNDLMCYETIKNKINKIIFKDGYFFDLNNDIIILYKLKKEFCILEYYYNYICRESNKILSYN